MDRARKHLVTRVNDITLLENGKPAKRVTKKEKRTTINEISEIKPGVYAVVKLKTPAKNLAIFKFSIGLHVDLIAKLLADVEIGNYQIANVSTSPLDLCGVTIEWKKEEEANGVITVYCTSQDEADALAELIQEIKLGIRHVESVRKLTLS